jgi:hypothetical protein
MRSSGATTGYTSELAVAWISSIAPGLAGSRNATAIVRGLRAVNPSGMAPSFSAIFAGTSATASP